MHGSLALFLRWLINYFDRMISKHNENILFPLNSCSAYGQYEMLPNILNVETMLVPPDTTDKLQALDAGITVAVKMRYKTHYLECVDDLSDVYEKEIYNSYILTAMIWLCKI